MRRLERLSNAKRHANELKRPPRECREQKRRVAWHHRILSAVNTIGGAKSTKSYPVLLQKNIRSTWFVGWMERQRYPSTSLAMMGFAKALRILRFDFPRRANRRKGYPVLLRKTFRSTWSVGWVERQRYPSTSLDVMGFAKGSTPSYDQSSPPGKSAKKDARVSFIYTRGCGRIARPAFPAPSEFSDGFTSSKTRACDAVRSRSRTCLRRAV
jgi:hypothetical protein